MLLDYNHKPDRFTLVEQVGDKYSVSLRENIQQISEPVQFTVVDDEDPSLWENDGIWTADCYVGYIDSDIADKDRYVEEHFEELILAAKTEDKATEVRLERNFLLDQTDKYMSLDRLNLGSATTFITFLSRLKDALSGDIARYRQALRDIPSQEGFPWNVEWPVQPDSVE